jgi:hypothetical protein
VSKRTLFTTTALTPIAMLIGTSMALAAPAVSQTNWTLGGLLGAWDGSGFGAVQGSWTAPVTSMTGVQVDGILGTANGQFWGQLNGHYFWRNPNNGLLGLYAAATERFGFSDFRIGPEAELYSGQFTLSGVAGLKTGGGDNFFAQAKGSLYIEPNTKIYVGYQYDDGNFFSAGFEHLFTGTNLSAFSEVRAGEGTAGIWGGIRFYFGQPGKSLENRDREDIAPLWMNVTDRPSSSADTTTASGTTAPSGTTPGA